MPAHGRHMELSMIVHKSQLPGFSRTHLRIAVFFVSLCWLAAGAGCGRNETTLPCTDTLGCIVVEPLEPVRIGVLQPLSGGAVAGGMTQVRSIRLAVEKHGGSILGHPVDLVVEDSRCTAEGGSTAATKLALNRKTAGVIGTHCSASAATAARVLSDAGIVMISGSNSAPSLTSANHHRAENWHPGYFRTMFNGGAMARAAARFAYQRLGIQRAAVLDDGDLYTSEFSSVFAQSFKELGGSVVIAASINKGDRDMDPVISSILIAGAECVYFPIYQQEAEQFVKAFSSRPEKNKITFIGGGALLTESFLHSSGESARGMYFATVLSPDTEAGARLRDAFEEKFGSPPEHASYAHGFDAADLLLTAIETIAVKRADNTLIIGRKALQDALYATRGFPGTTGNLTCDEFGDCSADQIRIVRLVDPAGGLESLKSSVVFTVDPRQEHN